MMKGKKTRNKLCAVLLVVVSLLVCCFVISCNDEENYVEYEDIQGYVRTVGFQNVAHAKICYNGAVKSISGDDGKFTIKVQREDYNLLTGQIALEDSLSLTYFDYITQQLVIIKTEEEMELTDFYFISGKVVEYYNGETAVDGSVLCIDDMVVKTFSTSGNDRNFDLAFVHKDSVISAYKEGYTCHLEVYGPEITGICVADILTITEAKALYVNGKDVILKVIEGGFSFRLKVIEG